MSIEGSYLAKEHRSASILINAVRRAFGVQARRNPGGRGPLREKMSNHAIRMGMVSNRRDLDIACADVRSVKPPPLPVRSRSASGCGDGGAIETSWEGQVGVCLCELSKRWDSRASCLDLPGEGAGTVLQKLRGEGISQ